MEVISKQQSQFHSNLLKNSLSQRTHINSRASKLQNKKLKIQSLAKISNITMKKMMQEMLRGPLQLTAISICLHLLVTWIFQEPKLLLLYSSNKLLSLYSNKVRVLQDFRLLMISSLLTANLLQQQPRSKILKISWILILRWYLLLSNNKIN
jgi:hypothetical protein